MINVFTFPGGVTINPPHYLLDDDGEVMRFQNEASARDFLKAKAIVPDHVHYEEEEEGDRVYRDVKESYALALAPFIGKVLTPDIIKEIGMTVADAVTNNLEKM